jgi:hypothetical protein
LYRTVCICRTKNHFFLVYKKISFHILIFHQCWDFSFCALYLSRWIIFVYLIWESCVGRNIKWLSKFILWTAFWHVASCNLAGGTNISEVWTDSIYRTEEVGFCKTLLPVCQATWHQISEDRIIIFTFVWSSKLTVWLFVQVESFI